MELLRSKVNNSLKGRPIYKRTFRSTLHLFANSFATGLLVGSISHVLARSDAQMGALESFWLRILKDRLTELTRLGKTAVLPRPVPDKKYRMQTKARRCVSGPA